VARLIRLLLSAVAALACLAPAARAAEPGVVLSGGTFFESPQALDAVHRSGARWVRMYLYRNEMEPAPGRLNGPLLAAYQRTIGRYLWEGVKTELVLVGTPSWESGSADPLAAPDPAGFAAFARQVSAALPGVGAYEVWNEPDAEKWWHPAPDAAAYTALLRAAYPALKEGSGGAEVIAGGMTGSNHDWLQALYAAGARDAFDSVSVHSNTACGIASPYSPYRDAAGRVSRWSFLGYREVLRTMDTAGDTGKGLWFTELGWSSSGAVCDQGVWAGQKAGGVSEPDQATFLRQAYHCIAGDPRVRGAFWFDLQDTGTADTPDQRFGLLRSDFSPKPAFEAFADVAVNGDRLTEPCGDFGGPAIAVLELGDRGRSRRHAGALHVKLRATDPQTVARISLFLDGRKVRNFGERAPVVVADYDIPQAKRLRRGRHTLLVLARDANGNDTLRVFTVRKVRR